MTSFSFATSSSRVNEVVVAQIVVSEEMFVMTDIVELLTVVVQRLTREVTRRVGSTKWKLIRIETFEMMMNRATVYQMIVEVRDPYWTDG